MTLPQGDTRLLDDPVAQRMLASTELDTVPGVAPEYELARCRFPGGLVAAGLAPEDRS